MANKRPATTPIEPTPKRSRWWQVFPIQQILGSIHPTYTVTSEPSEEIRTQDQEIDSGLSTARIIRRSESHSHERTPSRVSSQVRPANITERASSSFYGDDPPTLAVYSSWDEPRSPGRPGVALTFSNVKNEVTTRLNRLVDPATQGQQSPASTSSQRVQVDSLLMIDDFRQAYGLEIPHGQFMGICAYLCALLLLGYRIRSTELDSFICLYTKFETQLPRLVAQQIESRQPSLISYHHWFSCHRHIDTFAQNIMSEDKLRGIWAQHPYSFMKQRLRMDVIVKARYYEGTSDSS